MVERPLLRADETMPLARDMNIVVHPTWVHGGVPSWICDNYLIGPRGVERIHQFPQVVVER